MRKYLTIIAFFLILNLNIVLTKYVEGHLKTLENWAFLARFCFISQKGQYEYYIEYNKRNGVPNLLLYYDSENQWPAVYKTKKSCAQKEAVLSVQDHQIVPLTTYYPESMNSGCVLKHLLDVPPPDKTKTTIKPNTKPSEKNPPAAPPADGGSYFDQFLKTSTENPEDENTTTSEDLSTTNVNEATTDIEDSEENQATTHDVENNENTTTSVYEKYEMESENLFDTTVTYNRSKIKRSTSNNTIWQASGRTERAAITVMCRQKGGFTSARERWWFIAVSNCKSLKGLDIKYKFLMTNGPPGDYWHEHFSADEMYILPILMFYCIIYMVLFFCTIICSAELRSRQLLHTTYKIFCISIILQEFGILCNSISYVKYALTGLGPSTTFGGVIMAASEVTFLLLMLLMAKGFTITRARLSCKSTVKLTVFVNAYIVTYLVLYVYQSEEFDPGEVLYLYESPAGLGLCGLRIGAWGIFICSVAATIKKYPEKGTFYYPFSLAGSLWFISGPAFTLVANNHIDKWVRESVVCGVQMFIAFCGHIMFLFLTLPSRANKNFPYHVRTSQIGVAETVTGDFTHHPYEPQQTVVIPLTRRTEELLNGVYNQYLRRHEQSTLDIDTTLPVPPLRQSHISFPTQTPTAPVDNDEALSQNGQISPILSSNQYINTTDTFQNHSLQIIPDLDDIQATESRLNNATFGNGLNRNGNVAFANGTETNGVPTHGLPKVKNGGLIHQEDIDLDSKPNPFIVDARNRNSKLLLDPIDRTNLTFKNGDLTRLSFSKNRNLYSRNLNQTSLENGRPQNNRNEFDDDENSVEVPVHLFAAKPK